MVGSSCRAACGRVEDWRGNSPGEPGTRCQAQRLRTLGVFQCQRPVEVLDDRLGRGQEIRGVVLELEKGFARLCGDPTLVPLITQQLHNACAPSCGVVITTTPDADQTILATGHRLVPLRAVAHLRKGGFVIENIEAYLDGVPAAEEPSSETSLRLMHFGRVALIQGKQLRLLPQVYRFLSVLETAEGEPVHKRTLADELDIAVDRCKGTDIFKRHRDVYRTFVGNDTVGNYWLKPVLHEMCI